MSYSNSAMVVHTNLSPNNSGQRAQAIDRISPHCVVGQCTAEGLGAWFARSSTQASSNYGIDKDGRVGLYVTERNRSWCTSSSANDNRAVTIECASDTTSPYRMNDAVYQSLVRLCADICKRNGKTKLLWLGDKDKALAYAPGEGEMVITVHRWFANKACPGDWLYSRLGDLAGKVNAILAGGHATLRQGFVGDDVKDMQKRLIEAGYSCGSAGADGDFGNGTLAAVKKFQTANSLDADGVVGPATWAVLDGADKPEEKDEGADTSGESYLARVRDPLTIYRDCPEPVGTCATGVYTIVEEKEGYGKLKSGAGWIDLTGVTRV